MFWKSFLHFAPCVCATKPRWKRHPKPHHQTQGSDGDSGHDRSRGRKGLPPFAWRTHHSNDKASCPASPRATEEEKEKEKKEKDRDWRVKESLIPMWIHGQCKHIITISEYIMLLTRTDRRPTFDLFINHICRPRSWRLQVWYESLDVLQIIILIYLRIDFNKIPYV